MSHMTPCHLLMTACLVGMAWAGAAAAEPGEGTVSDVEAPAVKAGATAGNKRPMPPIEWVAGPATDDRAAVKAWLADLSPETPVRLPVRVTRGPLGGVASATLHGLGGDALSLRLDDSRMGIALADRLRQACGRAEVCAVWLIGAWVPKHPLPGAPEGMSVAVRAVDGVIADGGPRPRLSRGAGPR